MTISVRLDRKTGILLDRLSRGGRRSKSDVIRQAIHEMTRGEDQGRSRREETLYDRLSPFIGCIKSNGTLISGDWRSRWKARIRQRNFR